MRGQSPEHGWGIEKRLEWARTLRERSVAGEEAARRWAQALASIRDRSACPAYEGLELTPQLGLLPIAQDAASGLWEFAHLLSGEPAERKDDGSLRIEKGTGIVLVLIPGGTFWMGAQGKDPQGRNYSAVAFPDQAPLQEIRLEPFFLSKYEVTQDQWTRFAAANPSYFVNRPAFALTPVEQVSWSACGVFTRRLGLTLPTEAQWEYAARAGTTSPWWTGDERESLFGAANIADQSLERTHAVPGFPYEEWLDDGSPQTNVVGSYAANPYGLHDVHGNVHEWCREVKSSYGSAVSPIDAERQPDVVISTSSSGVAPNVYRGGAFLYPADFATSSYRGENAASYSAQEIGLRPARPITRD